MILNLGWVELNWMFDSNLETMEGWVSAGYTIAPFEWIGELLTLFTDAIYDAGNEFLEHFPTPYYLHLPFTKAAWRVVDEYGAFATPDLPDIFSHQYNGLVLLPGIAIRFINFNPALPETDHLMYMDVLGEEEDHYGPGSDWTPAKQLYLYDILKLIAVIIGILLLVNAITAVSTDPAYKKIVHHLITKVGTEFKTSWLKQVKLKQVDDGINIAAVLVNVLSILSKLTNIFGSEESSMADTLETLREAIAGSETSTDLTTLKEQLGVFGIDVSQIKTILLAIKALIGLKLSI